MPDEAKNALFSAVAGLPEADQQQFAENECTAWSNWAATNGVAVARGLDTRYLNATGSVCSKFSTAAVGSIKKFTPNLPAATRGGAGRGHEVGPGGGEIRDGVWSVEVSGMCTPGWRVCVDGVVVSALGPVLRVQDVCKGYRHRPVLRGVSLELCPGQLVGIVGENGAGKSTLLRTLAGDLAADSGVVERAGLLGCCPQEAVLHQALSVEQHLQFFQTAYGITCMARAFKLLDQLNFSDYRHERVEALSGGTRQKLNLVLALMHDPKVLLLDEPYQGFDWETYLRFWDLTADLRNRDCAVLVVSHLAYDTSRLDALYRLQAGVLRQVDQAGSEAMPV
ncbi:ABC transporter ATP-binding protein [Streptomyces sp. NPDC020800]|uniref:ABC transporter ATP-binding protein n=1 Tax=Streptomyces sp. NPDC020800 TaxID=3365092 RepID=UPI003795A1BF